MTDLITDSIDALCDGKDLSLETSSAVLEEIMSGNATEIQIAGFLVALRTKGKPSMSWQVSPGPCARSRLRCASIAPTCWIRPAPEAADARSTSLRPPR